MRRFIKHILTSSVLALLLSLITGCGVELMESEDANVDLLLAVEYKRSECGSVPPVPIFVLDDLDRNALAGCVIAIMSAPCPMTEYPLMCIRMYGQNVPGTVDIQDALVP